jgi:L-lactate dehydrogenase complex protein LldG
MVAKAMSTAREEILARIRATQSHQAPTPVRGYRQTGSVDADARVALFCERVVDYRAEVVRVSATEVSEAVERLCTSRNAKRLVAPGGFPRPWLPGTVDIVEDAQLPPRELDRVDGVLSGCTLAIAETGTLVLSAAPAEGRRALTLIPDLHVCVVSADQIVETVPEAIRLLGAVVRRTRRPLTFISGPSATSDIELSRVEGVHGPRSLCVLVVD